MTDVIEKTEPSSIRANPALGGSLESYIQRTDDGHYGMRLLVDGMHCAGCQNRIETRLEKIRGVVEGRVNLTARRLSLTWQPAVVDVQSVIADIEELGFRLVPFNPEKLSSDFDQTRKRLVRAMAVAGFATANIMLLSVAVWAGLAQDMQPVTRSLMHWISALIAVPAVAYAGMPFFESAAAALKGRRANMDVPISLAVLMATAMSLIETARGADHVYFDSATALLFFLLIGRFLEQSARGRARSAVEHLLALNASAVTVLNADGTTQPLPPEEVRPGMRVLVAAGGRIPVDGQVIGGVSDVDGSLITGESIPVTVREGSAVHAGAVNLTAALTVEVAAAGNDTLLAEIGRLLEAAEQRRARYVDVAARIVKIYAPVVHILAAVAFVGWFFFGAVAWQDALLIAVAVLIITCPCALALAVPVVQVVAANRLFRQGILVKSPTALERLAQVDTVVFDKTGTLTEGLPKLLIDGAWTQEDLRSAACLAAVSLHPLARALTDMAPAVPAASGVEEVPGHGLRRVTARGETRLGRGDWCGATESTSDMPELWLARPGRDPVRFAFIDTIRDDAAETIQALRDDGMTVEILSGDRPAAVARVAEALSVDRTRAGAKPADKIARLEELARQGRRVCMVGDGLNDAPALAAASASLSPATAADISQTASDVVFQGQHLAPVAETLRVARRADSLVRQNFALAFTYNVLTVPLAMAGLVTPLIAAVAMSTSSIIVICNALRLGRMRRS